jgi:hypothetical protein
MKIKSLNDIKSVAAYLSRVGAEARSLKTAVVKEQSGKYWKDLAVIRVSRDGKVDCNSLQFAPTDLEQAAITAEIATVEWPSIKPIKSLINAPDMIRDAHPDSIFEFRNEGGQIVFVQVRVEGPEGKAYIPWTYWDDDEWRCCEPDGALPLFNVDKIGDNSTVFVHEGPKAARYCQWMVEGKTAQAKQALKDHPWGKELSGAAHVGWIGGALSPYRTDWSPLKRAGVKRVYIVADNDEAGRSAVPAISQQLRITTFTIQFTDEFPASFDLHDKFPDKMFGSADSVRVYIGPSFRDCLHPATWATDLIPPPTGKGKPTAVLRDSFKGMWAYVEEADLFVCTEMPDIIRPEPILNKMLASFSHVNDTARLITKAYTGRAARVCYRPDERGLSVTFRGSSAINLHVPPTIQSTPGDPKPFLDFLEYLFVNPQERKQAERWCATLIARPDVRMIYGMLLISETQGVGKTTLGASILAPLVGLNNVSFPSESDVVSAFNDWVANKRLAVVGEIYSGSSWKAYNCLKQIITDKDVTVNQKYQRQYTIENWCHIIACSNSMRALKMENDDRRWFYPECVEVPWPKERFAKLRSWLESGGLNIIKHWAERYGDYVSPSERAPMTERKREMIEGSRSEAQREAVAIAETIREHEKPLAVLIKDVHAWCKAANNGRIFDSDYELRRAMIEAGLFLFQRRIKIGGRLQYVLMNNKLKEAVQRCEEAAEIPKIIKNSIAQISSFMSQEI